MNAVIKKINDDGTTAEHKPFIYKTKQYKLRKTIYKYAQIYSDKWKSDVMIYVHYNYDPEGVFSKMIKYHYQEKLFS
jgi:hypothetical protein